MKTDGETSFRQTKEGILPRSKVIELEIYGTNIGLVNLFKISKSKRKISPEFIKEIHKYCFEKILSEKAGKYRTEQVSYSGKEAPHYSKIPELIKTLCDDVNHMIDNIITNEDLYIEKIIEMLSLFQHRFVYIHPFLDYNGRMSRLFTNYLLAINDLPIVEINTDDSSNRKKYIRSLQEADNGNYLELQKIITKALNESIDQSSK